MILVFQDFAARIFQLRRHRLFIVVIETVTFAADLDAQGDGDAMPSGLVQQFQPV